MGAQPNVVNYFPLNGGLDEKTHPQHVMPGQAFIQLSNLVQRKSGSWEKRPGNVQLSGTTILNARIVVAPTTGTLPAAALKTIGYRNELDVITPWVSGVSPSLYSYSPDANLWSQNDFVPDFGVTRNPMFSSGVGNVTSWDIAVNAAKGIGAIAWVTGQIATVIVYDTASNSTILPAFFFSGNAGIEVRLFALGNSLFIATKAPADTNIGISRLDLTSAATIASTAGFTASGNVNATSAASAPWDVWALNDRYVVVTSDGASHLAVTTYSETGTQDATVNVATSTANLLACCVGGVQTDTLWVGWVPTSTFTAIVSGLNPTSLATTQTATTIISTTNTEGNPNRMTIADSGKGAAAGGLVAVGCGPGTSPASAATYFAPFGTAAGAVTQAGNSTKAYRALIDTRPFWLGNGQGPYMFVRYSPEFSNVTDVQNTAALIDCSQPTLSVLGQNIVDYLRPVGIVAPKLCGEANPAALAAPSHIVVTSTKAQLANPVLKTTLNAAIELVTFDSQDPTRYQSAPYGDVLGISGGVTSVYDGRKCLEIGFLVKPAPPTVTLGAAGNVNGSVQYVVIWEQFDGRGWIAISEPSNPTAAAPVNQQVTVKATSLFLTNRIKYTRLLTGQISGTNANGVPVRAVLYRTAAAGQVYYRVVGSETLAGAIGSQVSIVDNMSDATLTANAPLYTQPGDSTTAKPRQCPTASKHIIQHQDRLILLWDDGHSFGCSGQLVNGEEPWFNVAFQYPMPNRGVLTALASFDGHVVAFSRDQISITDGGGPVDNGIGQDFSPPQLLVTDVGCIEPRSVVTTAMGVFFQSARGIELLDRSLSVQPFFGRPVEKTLQTNPVITSAILRDDYGRIEWTCLTAEGASTGVKIYFDLEHGTWSSAPIGAQSACIFGDSTRTYAWCTAQGAIWQERALTDPSAYLDGAAFVPWTMEFPQVNLGGLQGWQRIQKVQFTFDALSPSDITLSVSYDAPKAYNETHSMTAAAIALLDFPQLLLFPKTNDGNSMQFIFSESTPTGAAVGNGQGARMLGVSIEGEAEPGLAHRQDAAVMV